MSRSRCVVRHPRLLLKFDRSLLGLRTSPEGTGTRWVLKALNERLDNHGVEVPRMWRLTRCHRARGVRRQGFFLAASPMPFSDHVLTARRLLAGKTASGDSVHTPNGDLDDSDECVMCSCWSTRAAQDRKPSKSSPPGIYCVRIPD